MKKKIITSLRKMQNQLLDLPRFKGKALFERQIDQVVAQINLYKLSDNVMNLLLKEKKKDFKEIMDYVEKLEPPKKAG